MSLESSTLETYVNLIESKLTQMKQLEEHRNNAKARRDAAQRRVAELEAKLTKCKEEKCNQESNSSDNNSNVLSLEKKVKEYNEKWAVLMHELALRNKVLNHTLKYSNQDMMNADITLTSYWLDHWGDFFMETSSTLREMKNTVKEVQMYKTQCDASAANNNSKVSLMSLKVLTDNFDEVCRLQLQVRSIVGRERYRRYVEKCNSNININVNSDDDSYYVSSEEMCNVQDLLDNQTQLLDWCATQSETLHSLTELNELHIFLKSLHANVKVMDSNFLMLLEQSKHIVQHKRSVHEALKASQKAWIALCLNTYSTIRRKVIECHNKAELETLCSAFNECNIAEDVLTYLSNAHESLSMLKSSLENAEMMTLNVQKNNNAESEVDIKGKELVDQLGTSIHDNLCKSANLLYECDKLINETNAFATITTHLSDFTIRENCVRPHFEALQEELLSDVTSSVLCLPSEVEYDGKAEFVNRMAELREWIDVKSQKGTYLKLLVRIEETKKVVNQYPDRLFPDDNQKEELYERERQFFERERVNYHFHTL